MGNGMGMDAFVNCVIRFPRTRQTIVIKIHAVYSLRRALLFPISDSPRKKAQTPVRCLKLCSFGLEKRIYIPVWSERRVCTLQNATWLVPALLHAAVAKETKADGKDLRIDTIIIERLYYKLQEFNHYAWIKNVIAGIQKMKHKRRNSW